MCIYIIFILYQFIIESDRLLSEVLILVLPFWFFPPAVWCNVCHSFLCVKEDITPFLYKMQWSETCITWDEAAQRTVTYARVQRLYGGQGSTRGYNISISKHRQHLDYAITIQIVEEKSNWFVLKNSILTFIWLDKCSKQVLNVSQVSSQGLKNL